MQIKFRETFHFFAFSVSLLLVVACVPVLPAATETATPIPTFTPAYGVTLTIEAALTAAALSETPAPVVTPTTTAPAGVTIVPLPGDLGWGAVHGKITDGTTNLPIDGATVKCEHFSYTSPYLCNAVTATNADGIYSFVPVFFHDTDRITVLVEAPGYIPARVERSFFTQPDFHADLDLFPLTDDTPTPTLTAATPTPYLMCTPPPCTGGSFACGNPDGCPGGCGTICITSTPKP